MPNEEVKIKNTETALRNATDLFLQHGIDGTTKEMIVKASGLSRKSIDRYFEDKTDCVVQVAKWLGGNVWRKINEQYPKSLFDAGAQSGAVLLERYMKDLKQVFIKEVRLFVFYAEFKLYILRHSSDYNRDYTRMLDTINCRRITEEIYRLGNQDGSLSGALDPQTEAEYFCRAYFGFLANMATAYEYDSKRAIMQIDRYIDRVLQMYAGKPQLG